MHVSLGTLKSDFVGQNKNISKYFECFEYFEYLKYFLNIHKTRKRCG
jgi:hypothetical protein